MAIAGWAGSAGSALAGQTNNSIVGSWLTSFTRSDGVTLTGLETFHQDGGMLSSPSDHLTGTTAHGAWQLLSNGQYAYSLIRLNIDAAGNYTGYRAIDSDVTLDASGQNWTAATRVTFYDISGNPTMTLSSTDSAMRIPLVRRTDPRTQVINPPSSGQ